MISDTQGSPIFLSAFLREEIEVRGGGGKGEEGVSERGRGEGRGGGVGGGGGKGEEPSTVYVPEMVPPFSILFWFWDFKLFEEKKLKEKRDLEKKKLGQWISINNYEKKKLLENIQETKALRT